MQANVVWLRTFLSIALALFVTAWGSAQVASQSTAEEPATEIVLASDVKWTPLNPLRGDKSPQAGTLWGDRTRTVPTGFLVKFAKGFSSPPHIHNITYRAVVISGLVHNDDPEAAKMWMSAGSFWTQPKGEVHITAASGPTNMALVEIDNGPYLVQPSKEAFDRGERPINIDASNVVWVDAPGFVAAVNGPKVAYLWGSPQDGQSSGTFVKLPAGFNGRINSSSSTFRAVVIKGQPQYLGADAKTMEPGSYFGSAGMVAHQMSCQVNEECIIYIRSNGKYEVVSEQPGK
ncbi:MAG: DUF4437 domain-containing protein [Alphaproteobacteria bacterium]|nr:DUF4437 domain-containing protein [Alphaproteobacteria bacterium]